MRWLALLFQVILPGPIGFYLGYAMVLGLPATSARDEIPLVIILGGTVIGVLQGEEWHGSGGHERLCRGPEVPRVTRRA